MNVRNIEDKDYNLLLELDKKVYPTDSPVNENILNSWYKNNKEFGIIYENKDNEIGIHIYHIEKFNDNKEFYQNCLEYLSKILFKLRKENSNLKVIGFSALCVTSQGIGLFSNKLNCREREFVSPEHILDKDGKIIIFDTNNNYEIEKKILEGYNYRNRCKMLVTYPNEISLVWKYLN